VKIVGTTRRGVVERVNEWARRGMIQARITIYSQPGRREDIVRSILSLIESSRLDSGCRSCRLYADVADADALTLVEEWETRADMERRLRSAAYGQLVQLMEMSREPPETVFHTITETRGLEALREIRIPEIHAASRSEGM
jgi:quinol monooxygenase YgiN